MDIIGHTPAVCAFTFGYNHVERCRGVNKSGAIAGALQQVTRSDSDTGVSTLRGCAEFYPSMGGTASLEQVSKI